MATVQRSNLRWCLKCGDYVYAHREPDCWRCVDCGNPTEVRVDDDRAMMAAQQIFREQRAQMPEDKP